MKQLLVLLPLLLTACLQEGGGSSAKISAAPDDGTLPPVQPPPVVLPWSAPQTAAQAEAALDGTYKLVTDQTKTLQFNGASKTASGFIPSRYFQVIGGNVIYFNATCGFNVSNYYITAPLAQNIYQVWTSVSSYTLSGGNFNTTTDCQMSSQQGASHTTMQVHFDSEKCITALFMRDSTTGRQFCKE